MPYASPVIKNIQNISFLTVQKGCIIYVVIVLKFKKIIIDISQIFCCVAPPSNTIFRIEKSLTFVIPNYCAGLPTTHDDDSGHMTEASQSQNYLE
jgi:hypothetical protein